MVRGIKWKCKAQRPMGRWWATLLWNGLSRVYTNPSYRVIHEISAKNSQLPLYNLGPERTRSPSEPPPYSPSATTPDGTADIQSSKPFITNKLKESRHRNRRRSIICIGIAVVFLVIIPLIIMGGVISASKKVDCKPISGVVVDGGSFEGETICAWFRFRSFGFGWEDLGNGTTVETERPRVRKSGDQDSCGNGM